MPGAEEFVYARGGRSVDQVQAETARFWQALDNPGGSALEAGLSAAGLDRAALVGIDRKNAITVRAGTSGVDLTTAILIVTLAPSANRIIEGLWTEVLLPRIRQRWGDDAIGEEKRSQG
jgi:hypothetical protein